MNAPAMIYVWNGHALEPVARFSRLAEQSFTAGHAYRMIVDEEKEERRSLEQNAKMWALLTEFSQQLEHGGRYYEPERWKAILLHAWGQEIEFLPSLDGNTFIPYGNQSSKMSKRDMISFLEFILAEGRQTRREICRRSGRPCALNSARPPSSPPIAARWARCEGCGGLLVPGKFAYDHRNPSEFSGDASLENCQCLCVGCHGAKTVKRDIPAIAKSNRIRTRHAGIRKDRKIRAWRKFDGSPVIKPRER
jgi:5-methylcytosine-specific restriction endonuclease McrA